MVVILIVAIGPQSTLLVVTRVSWHTFIGVDSFDMSAGLLYVGLLIALN